MCRILRGLEAPGGPLEAGSDECLEDPGSGRFYVLYSTCLGGPRGVIYSILRVWEALGVRVFNGLERP